MVKACPRLWFMLSLAAPAALGVAEVTVHALRQQARPPALPSPGP